MKYSEQHFIFTIFVSILWMDVDLECVCLQGAETARLLLLCVLCVSPGSRRNSFQRHLLWQEHSRWQHLWFYLIFLHHQNDERLAISTADTKRKKNSKQNIQKTACLVLEKPLPELWALGATVHITEVIDSASHPAHLADDGNAAFQPVIPELLFTPQMHLFFFQKSQFSHFTVILASHYSFSTVKWLHPLVL